MIHRLNSLNPSFKKNINFVDYFYNDAYKEGKAKEVKYRT